MIWTATLRSLHVYNMPMTTRLEAPLKRELTIAGEPYVLTITPEGFKLVPKGKRKGYEMAWEAFVSGDEALATALVASVSDGPTDGPAKSVSKRTGKKRDSP